MKTLTPRTDAFEEAHTQYDNEVFIGYQANFCRELEREIADLRQQLEAAKLGERFHDEQANKYAAQVAHWLAKHDAAEARTVDPDEIIAALIKDIRDRRGIGDEWESIDVDIRNEIAGEWRTLIRALLKGKDNGQG
jgi:hypothetical protein